MDGIVFRLHDKRGRRLRGNAYFRVRRKVLFRERQVSGIDNYSEIRTAAQLICRIDGTVQAMVEVGPKRGGKVGSC